jgi:hypothetical protein
MRKPMLYMSTPHLGTQGSGRARRLAHAACSILLVLVVTACGGGGSIVEPLAVAPPGDTPAAPVPPGDTPATPGNSVVATAAPPETVKVTIGASQSITLTFASSDDQPASNLTVALGSLPPGWRATGSDFACTRVARDGGCKLALTYAPTAAAAASTLDLGYSYIDSAGKGRTGSVPIAYQAVAATLAYVTNYDDHNVRKCRIAGDGSLTDCSTAGESLLYRPTTVAFHDTTAYVLNENGPVVQCQVDAAGVFDGCKDSGAYGMDRPFGMVIQGSRVYMANPGNGPVTWCAIGPDGGLGSDCRGSGDSQFRQSINLAFLGDRMYVINTDTNIMAVCDIQEDGSFASCRDSGATLLNRPEGLAIAGSAAYITNYSDRSVTRCAIGATGQVTGCARVATTPWTSAAIAVSGPHAYIAQSSDHAVLHCPVAADGSLGTCTNAGASGLNSPLGITLR